MRAFLTHYKTPRAPRCAVLFILASLSQAISAQEPDALPDSCIQMPQRTQVCPNLLYKRAPISIAALNIQEGQAVCICMADFANLRLEADDEQGKVDQLVEVSRSAARLNISETELLTLIRK